MTKFEPCPGATSDHAWRSIAVIFVDATNKSSFKVQGATWNMQAKCESKIANQARSKGATGWVAHGNNPLDVDETWNEYTRRKEQQREELKAIMSRGNDFIFIQEPDWLGHNHCRVRFESLLAEQGWAMVVTPDKGFQKLVTLYNPMIMTPVLGSTQGQFKSDISHKFRGFQTNFVHKATNKPFALVNLHLEYGKDYRSEMGALQQQMVKQDMPCVMGGDTNNVQNIQLDTMLGDWHAATCVESNGNGVLTTIHSTESGQVVQKTYDGFFVNPGSTTCPVITDKGGMRFNDLGKGVVEYVAYQPTKYFHHESNIGCPWQRRKHTAPEVPHDDMMNNNPSFALALFASSAVICGLSIVALVMMPGPVGIVLGVVGLLLGAGMFGVGLSSVLQEAAKAPSPGLSNT